MTRLEIRKYIYYWLFLVVFFNVYDANFWASASFCESPNFPRICITYNKRLQKLHGEMLGKKVSMNIRYNFVLTRFGDLVESVPSDCAKVIVNIRIKMRDLYFTCFKSLRQT